MPSKRDFRPFSRMVVKGVSNRPHRLIFRSRIQIGAYILKPEAQDRIGTAGCHMSGLMSDGVKAAIVPREVGSPALQPGCSLRTETGDRNNMATLIPGLIFFINLLTPLRARNPTERLAGK